MTVRRRGRAHGVPIQTKRRSCEGKTKYQTEESASGRMWRRIRNGANPRSINVYECKFCHAWHVGSTPGNLGKR